MRRAQDGDRDAYRRLLGELAPLLRAFLRRWATGPDDLDDLQQDALMTVHRIRHTYDPARPLEPWLFAVTRRVAIDRLRRRRRRAHLEVAIETSPDSWPASHAESGDVEQRLAAALADLPPRQREAFELLNLDGLSVAAGAARAGTTPGALRVRAHRAYAALRARFGGRA